MTIEDQEPRRLWCDVCDDTILDREIQYDIACYLRQHGDDAGHYNTFNRAVAIAEMFHVQFDMSVVATIMNVLKRFGIYNDSDQVAQTIVNAVWPLIGED